MKALNRYSISLLAVIGALSATARHSAQDWAEEQQNGEQGQQGPNGWQEQQGPEAQHGWQEQNGQEAQHGWQEQQGQQGAHGWQEQNGQQEQQGSHEHNGQHEHRDGGVGIVIAQGEDGLRVIEILGNGPAASARLPGDHRHLHAGDYIWAIDGNEAHSLSLEEAADRIRGIVGSPVSLTIRRSGVEFTISLIRECSRHWGR